MGAKLVFQKEGKKKENYSSTTLIRHLTSHSASCCLVTNSLQPHGLLPTRLLCPHDFPDKNTGVGCRFLLQVISLTQGSNPCLLHLLHWQADSLPLSHQGSPNILLFHLITSTPWKEGHEKRYIHALLCGHQLRGRRVRIWSGLDLLGRTENPVCATPSTPTYLVSAETISAHRGWEWNLNQQTANIKQTYVSLPIIESII